MNLPTSAHVGRLQVESRHLPATHLDVLVARLDEHVGDRRCDDILLLLVTMR
jgi:hypothetical protein